MMSRWSRRKLLAATAGLVTAPLRPSDPAEAPPRPAAPGGGSERGNRAPLIPRRPLGRTGMRVSILGLGGGSQFLRACRTDEEAVELLNAAIEGGINYLDTAASYGNGESERRYGLVLERRRREVYVASKTGRRDRDGALRQIERSLKNLRTDSLDLIQIHAISGDEELKRILARDGVFPALLELKRQKVVRAVGITGHASAARMKQLLERMEGLDTLLCPVNPARETRPFEEVLLPAARARGLGIVAMKATAQGALLGEGPGKADAATLIRYAMSEPGVATVIVGPGSLANLKKNLSTAQRFVPLLPAERAKLAQEVSAPGHRLAYRQPGYQDA